MLTTTNERKARMEHTMLTAHSKVFTEDITGGRAALCFADGDKGTFRRTKILGARRRLAAGQYDSDEVLDVVVTAILRDLSS